jgi:Rrf2 family protein
MRVPAKVEYAIQAAAELAAASPGLVKAERIAKAQQIPPKYLQNILTQLRNADLVESHWGGTEGYRLARPADKITLADIIRAVDGPLASVRGTRPPVCSLPGPGQPPAEGLDRGPGQPTQRPGTGHSGRPGRRHPAQLGLRPHRRPGRLGLPLVSLETAQLASLIQRRGQRPALFYLALP